MDVGDAPPARAARGQREGGQRYTAENVPESMSVTKAFAKWKKNPEDGERMAKAVATMIFERFNEGTDIGEASGAGSIFKRKQETDASSDGSGEVSSLS